MGLLKTLLYGTTIWLLASCSVFTSVPPKVIEGQRGVYHSVILLEENANAILDAYEQDNKAAVA